jgi:tyrosinase
MARTRHDIWKLANTWDNAVLWYARGVQMLRSRSRIDDVTSWRYLAAIHGVDEFLWRGLGFLSDSEQLPGTPEFAEDSNECQHHTWYFLPWHRGYVAAFEKMVMAAVTQLGGPSDWALPYWNYSDSNNPNARTFPPAFASDNWPDGTGNPLFVQQRYGTGDGTIVIRQRDVALGPALMEPRFAGTTTGGSPGFGGASTPFKHSGGGNDPAEGTLEQFPHDTIHGLVGGARNNDPSDPLNLGLMSAPEIAALDPIFWLHHANIDRLWEVWLQRPGNHKNPTQTAWLDGPLGSRVFIMPAPDGTRNQFTARQMLDTTSPGLDYVYEDVSDPLAGQERVAMRMRTLGMAMAPPTEVGMPTEPEVELLGANAQPVQLGGPGAETSVRMDHRVTRKVMESFSQAGVAAGARREPDRVFLNLENIKGSNDAAIFDVYVGLAPGDTSADHPDNFAGVVSLFGLREATNVAAAHGGNGMTKVIEITEVIDRLHLSGSLDVSQLPVRFVPVQGLGRGTIEIGRVSIYRQGG